MDIHVKVDPDKLGHVLRTYQIQLKMSEQSMYELFKQKYEICHLMNNSNMDIDFIEGLVNLIEDIQDQTYNQGIFKEDVIFPVADEYGPPEGERYHKDEIPLENIQDNNFKDLLSFLKSLTFENLPLLVNHPSTVVAGYAKHCFNKGELDLPGYMAELLKEI